MRLEKLLEFTNKPPRGAIVNLPFANQETIDWLGTGYIMLAYANQPRTSVIFQRDVFLKPPPFTGSYIIAFPPWQHRNTAEDKTPFDNYGTDNLYKCFIKMILRDAPQGGTIVIPFKFLTGTRDSEIERRRRFMALFDIKSLTVFTDTLISNEIPLVIEFLKRTDYSPAKSPELKVKLVSDRDIKDRVWEIDTSKPGPFIKQASLFYENYTIQEKSCKISIHIHIGSSYDTDATFYLSRQDPAILHTKQIPDSTKLIIRGFLSNKLKAKIQQDYYNLVTNWLDSTSSVFLPFIVINGKRNPNFQIETTIEALKRIILWYYLN